jgi:hypothetical protein
MERMEIRKAALVGGGELANYDCLADRQCCDGGMAPGTSCLVRRATRSLRSWVVAVSCQMFDASLCRPRRPLFHPKGQRNRSSVGASHHSGIGV